MGFFVCACLDEYQINVVLLPTDYDREEGRKFPVARLSS